jgi:hypothetical protein
MLKNSSAKIENKEKELDPSVNNDFEKKLVESGYKFFKDNCRGSIRGFQKRIADKFGTKYFIKFSEKLTHRNVCEM